MIPLYSPGSSALHRAPAGAKLIGLVLMGIGVALWRESPWAAAGAWLAVLCGFLLAYPRAVGAGRLLARLWGLKWLIVLISVPQLIFLTPAEAGLTTARIVAVVLLAGLFTLTTKVSAVMELV